MVRIGPSKQAIDEARDAILEILNSGAEQQTLRVALEVFRNVCEVKNVTITGCTFKTINKKDKETEI